MFMVMNQNIPNSAYIYIVIFSELQAQNTFNKPKGRDGCVVENCAMMMSGI